MSAVQLFDKGKAWECGIPLCKELAQIYEKEMFDYTKLAAILVRTMQQHWEMYWVEKCVEQFSWRAIFNVHLCMGTHKTMNFVIRSSNVHRISVLCDCLPPSISIHLAS